MRTTFFIVSNLIGLYSLLCVVRILVSWFPQMRGNAFESFLSQICDPFLSLFRFPFTQVGSLDFSPVLAFVALYFLQQIFAIFANVHTFNAFSLIGALLTICTMLLSSILTMLIVALAIRLVFEVTGRSYTRYCSVLDSLFAPAYQVVSSITGTGDTKLAIIVLLVLSIVAKIVLSILLSVF